MMTEEGEQVDSLLAAIKIIEARPEFGKEDVKRLNDLIGQNTKIWQMANEMKVEDDFPAEVKPNQTNLEEEESLVPKPSAVMPEGWRLRICGSQQYIVSPEGEQFQSRRKALQHLVARGAQESEVELMRETMAEDGWIRSDLLPSSWRFQKNNKRKGNVFLLPDGEVVTGRDSAAFRLDTAMEVANMSQFCESRTRERREADEGWEQEDETLPDGWRSKRAGQGRLFISKEGNQFMTRRLAIVHMSGQGYSEEEISKMRGGLAEEGWMEDVLLPPNWRFKTVAGGSGPGKEHIKFLTGEGQPLQGIDAALTLVKRSPNFNAREFDQLKVFVEIVRVRSRSARYDWQSGDPTVPEGWKSRSSGSKKFFLSPDGQSFPCRFGNITIFLISVSLIFIDISEVSVVPLQAACPPVHGEG